MGLFSLSSFGNKVNENIQIFLVWKEKSEV